jgi:hypothetical protein
MEVVPPELCQEMGGLHLEILPKGMLNEIRVQYNLKDRICNAQLECLEIWEIQELMKKGKCPKFREDVQGVYSYKDRICVPSDPALWREILEEGHDSKYCIHLGSTKMYADLKK